MFYYVLLFARTLVALPKEAASCEFFVSAKAFIRLDHMASKLSNSDFCFHYKSQNRLAKLEDFAASRSHRKTKKIPTLGPKKYGPKWPKITRSSQNQEEYFGKPCKKPLKKPLSVGKHLWEILRFLAKPATKFRF